MSHFIRASKYRHIYADPVKAEDKFDNLRLSTATGEQQYIKGNTKFMAVSLAGGGGPVGIFEHDKPGRMEPNRPVIAGHTSHVYDFDFNPFHEHVICTGSDDTTVKVWGIPEGGITENISEPLADMHGHGRKVTLVKFHPSASNVLGTVAADHLVKLWDIEKGVEMHSLSDHENLIQDIQWDHVGKTYATSSKDKHLRIVDPRENRVAGIIENAHEGAKSVKLTFLGARDKMVSVGFTRQSQRQIKMWDPRNIGEPIATEKIDQAAGVIIPYFDEDTSVLYLAGKGDGNIRFYEVVDAAPFIFKLGEYRSTVAAKGVGFVPKRGLDVLKCETARALKLTSNSIEPLKFIIPRKSDAFQEDIFPPTFAGVPGCTAEQWMDGLDVEPPKMSLDPSDGGAVQTSAAATPPPGMKTRSQLLAENEALRTYVTSLTEALTTAGAAVPPAPEGAGL